MSLINNMLKDLEKRQEKQELPLKDKIKVVNTEPQSKTVRFFKYFAYFFVFLGIIMAAQYALFVFHEAQNTPTAQALHKPLVSGDVNKKPIKPLTVIAKPEIVVKETEKPKAIATIVTNKAQPDQEKIHKAEKKILVQSDQPVQVKSIQQTKQHAAQQESSAKKIRIRYFSDQKNARLVLDYYQDLKSKVKRSYLVDNWVEYQFAISAKVETRIKDNYHDNIIEHFHIVQKKQKVIIRYRTLVPGTSKYHQLPPGKSPYYRFVIIIRPDTGHLTKKKVESRFSIHRTNQKVNKNKALFQLAEKAYQNGKLSRAQQKLGQLIAQAPYFEEAYLLLAKIQAEQGYRIAMEKTLKQGNHFNPNNIEIALLYARVLQKKGLNTAALKTLNKVKTQQQNSKLIAYKAALLQQMEHFSEAEKLYQQLLKKDKTKGKWWLGLALSLEGQNKLKMAKYAYQQALGGHDLNRHLIRYINQRLEALSL